MSRIDDVLPRLEECQRRPPAVDRGRAEAALQRHFEKIGMPALDIHWAPDLLSVRAPHGEPRPCTQWEVMEYLVTGTPDGFGPLCTSPSLRKPPLSWALASAWTERDERVFHLASPEDVVPGARSPGVVAAYALSARRQARERRDALLDLLDAFEAGLWLFWPRREAVVALARPAVFEERDRFHSADGPAIEWRGAFAAWFWKGVQVPAHVVERPATITLREIENEDNIERRRVLLERYGLERYLRDVDARPVLKDAFGELYRVPLGRGLAPLAMVAVVNATPEPDGSLKTYFLRVPPNVQTPKEAVAWTFGLAEDVYAPEVET